MEKKINTVLKESRLTNRLSAAAVIEKLKHYGIHVSVNTLYNYEAGHRNPDIETLFALCKIYNITDVLDEFGYKDEVDKFNELNSKNWFDSVDISTLKNQIDYYNCIAKSLDELPNDESKRAMLMFYFTNVLILLTRLPNELKNNMSINLKLLLDKV